jgi:hypothetical protein
MTRIRLSRWQAEELVELFHRGVGVIKACTITEETTKLAEACGRIESRIKMALSTGALELRGSEPQVLEEVIAQGFESSRQKLAEKGLSLDRGLYEAIQGLLVSAGYRGALS